MIVILKYVPWKWLLYIKARFLKLIPDIFKTQKMCNKVVEVDPNMLKYVPTPLKTHEIIKRAVEKCLHPMGDVPDHFKTQEMCEKPLKMNQKP